MIFFHARRAAWAAWLAAAIASVLTGCVTYTPPLDAQFKPAPGKAVLFGRFEKNAAANFALVVENVGRTRQYMIRFSSGKDLAAIQVEPDTYEITHFVAASAVNETIGRKPLKGWPYGMSFTAQPNAVYYIGDFVGSYRPQPMSPSFTVEPNAYYHFVDSVYANPPRYLVWIIEPAVDRYGSARDELLQKFSNLRGERVGRAYPERQEAPSIVK